MRVRLRVSLTLFFVTRFLGHFDMALSDVQIRNLKPQAKPYKRTDGEGLILEVRPTGAKIWRYRYRQADGKESMHTIGDYPAISLSDAREERRRLREQVRDGINPTQQRKLDRLTETQERELTLSAVAALWQAEMEKHWSANTIRQVRTFLPRDLLAEYGELPIKSVTSAHILTAIRKVEERGAPSIAKLIQQWSGGIMRYAIRSLIVDTDPTYALRGSIRMPATKHHAHLEANEIPEFMAALNRYEGFGLVPLAVRLQMLTFARTQELRMAEWDEFDLNDATWRVPAEKMKMRDKHIIPLAKQTIEVIHQIRDANWRKSKYLFPNMRRPDDCMTNTSILRAIENMGFKGRATGHGFRSTASTILNEHGFNYKAIELQLAHMERNKSKKAYDHALLLPERRELMQWWADYLDNCANNATP